MQDEITAVRNKGAIWMLPLDQRYFLVPNKGRGQRPVLDLCVLNKDRIYKPFGLVCLRGAKLKFRIYLKQFGLLASALVVIPLGCFYMRPVQQWVVLLKLNLTHLKVLFP